MADVAAASQAELEEKLRANEQERAAIAAEADEDRELAVFSFLVTGWVKQIEAGTVDWDDLIERLETALATAQRMRGEAG